jgi:F0F1-type ATP synthase membrane subunit a
MNLLGIIPTFESPTMNAAVPAGLAICTFAYFNGTDFARTELVT